MSRKRFTYTRCEHAEAPEWREPWLNTLEISEMSNTPPLMPAHEGSASITHNSHKNNYLTVAQQEEYQPEWFKGAWVSDESRAYAIANNELWELQWYPITPVGFNNLCAGRWEDIVAYMKEKGLA